MKYLNASCEDRVWKSLYPSCTTCPNHNRDYSGERVQHVRETKILKSYMFNLPHLVTSWQRILPVIIADAHRWLTALFGEPHHIQHRHAQTLLLGLVAHWNTNPAVQKVAPPLERENKCNNGKGWMKEECEQIPDVLPRAHFTSTHMSEHCFNYTVSA